MSGIGEQLRTAREAKGLSISDIEKATKIQGRYLEAIENNEFDKLPGDFYVRAFIRQYAQVVGLDGKELLSQYSGDIEEELEEHEKEVEAEKQEEEPVEAPTEQVYQPAPARQKQIAKEENYKEEKQDAKWRKLVPKLALGCGIVLIVVIAALVFANNKKSSSNSAEKASSSVTITSSKKSSSKKSSSASSSSKKKTSTIKVKSLGNSAFRVTGIKSSAPLVVRSSKQAIYYYVSVNNAITNQGTLQSGEKHTETVKNGSTLIVYLGTDTGVTVTIGGKKIPFTQVNGTSRLTIYLGANNNSTTGSSSSSSYSSAASSSYSSRTYSSQSSASQASSQAQGSRASSSQAQSSQASSSQAQSSQAQSSSKAQ
ncbi:XRE-like DNA-binding protein [Lactobacillus equicursoris 66c]|uniref:XRE-like DNA-binding protein n=1 Tax=Lactobacillus equicursoris 66c TaxID=872326 RepID=K0NPH9_9LACO|nr:helix-turn-helix transcriptional regulator [Lactobacillus equicursoris]CCK82743.1 XRE-like DNA-binding protein [Lactobacillus equicursoris 66c]